MSRWLPCKRYDFIRKIRRLSFSGPFSGTKHQFMIYKEHRLALPSNKEYSVPQLKFILREVEGILECQILLQEWNSL